MTKKEHEALPEKEKDAIKAYTMEIMTTIREILSRNSVFKEQLQYFLQNADLSNPSLLADYAAGLTNAAGKDLQRVLECQDVKDRLHQALLLLTKELELSKLQENISKEVHQDVSQKQKEFMLHQQLKNIKKQLGLEKDDKEELSRKYSERIENKVLPDEVQTVYEEEMSKLALQEPSSMEFSITRNYLDWLTSMPWGVTTEENFDLDVAEERLNKDHYGLEDVKDRILEFIAVGNILGSTAKQGKILCLLGPPGTGKTSIAQSIARALDRKYFRYSVGGMNDVSEIKGHRRTYIGALPGKLVQALKKTGCENPVVLVDEVDKIGHRGHQGDPSAALLEVFDPEQNNSFLDHYLDVPLDLSQVLFICTANSLETIPGPLLDRMDVVRLSGYVWQEKVHIVKEFIEPSIQTKTGIKPTQLVLTDEALSTLIRFYCREAGVRNLQKHIERIYQKAAVKLVRKQVEVVEVTEANLRDFVGQPKFTSDRMYDVTPAGVVMGLAWNSMGGAALYIESKVSDYAPTPSNSTEDASAGKSTQGSLFVTGMMGDVMRESSTIAYTVAKAQFHSMHPHSDFFSNRIHLHVPEGATPKDGPSAGITMITSLLSLALDRPLIPNVAMTGEVTLTGKVLGIGGVKEKVIAAKRAQISRLIFPLSNQAEYEELPDYITEGITAHFVSHYTEVCDIVLPQGDNSA
mmetsp:Transcript_12640/g.18127  ORF Transcript_12640/g.18127 Transcript_12640/m.18127 type:complete len:691 (+) Transcript_12640:40-2112(+)